MGSALNGKLSFRFGVGSKGAPTVVGCVLAFYAETQGRVERGGFERSYAMVFSTTVS